LVQTGFYLNAAIWLSFGVWSLIRIMNQNPEQGTTTWIVALLMFGNVGAMLICGAGIGTGRVVFYYLAIFVLVVNIILTLTDQFGIFDLITLLIDLILLGILITSGIRLKKPAV
jgi:hypothetical protein